MAGPAAAKSGRGWAWIPHLTAWWRWASPCVFSCVYHRYQDCRRESLVTAQAVVYPSLASHVFLLSAPGPCLGCWGSLQLAWGSLESPSPCASSSLAVPQSRNSGMGAQEHRHRLLPAGASLAWESCSHGLSRSRPGGWGKSLPSP